MTNSSFPKRKAAARHGGKPSIGPISSDWSFCEYYVPDEQTAVSAKPSRWGLFGRMTRHNP